MRGATALSLTVALVLLAPASNRVPGPALAWDCEGDCPEFNCTWADTPCVHGEVTVNGALTNGIQVYVKNKSEDYIYDPYGPDSVNCSPPLPIPETRTHYGEGCHKNGQWASYWETWCYGTLSPPPKPERKICHGDSILSRAFHQGQSKTVRAMYDTTQTTGGGYFRMPPIAF